MKGKNRVLENSEGFRLEEMVFGVTSRNIRGGKSVPHMGWEHAKSSVMRRQKEIGWDTQNPSTKLSREMFHCVRSYLPDNLKWDLKLYCALGTSFDFYHGIDGFFTAKSGFVSFDICYSKTRDIKADLFFDRTKVGLELWRFCYKVAEKLIATAQSPATNTRPA